MYRGFVYLSSDTLHEDVSLLQKVTDSCCCLLIKVGVAIRVVVVTSTNLTACSHSRFSVAGLFLNPDQSAGQECH